MTRSDSGCWRFPDEVTTNIFARLPVKSVLRIKCVCKSWHRLASDYYFRQIYNEISVKNPMVLVEITETTFKSGSSLLCVDNLRGASEHSLDFIDDRVKVRASCNGLLCCSSVPEKDVYYVCNPMTREYKILPSRKEKPLSRFYPNGEATLVGLCCNLLTQKYHVVLAGYHRSFGNKPERTFMCLVYDSESNKWNKYASLQNVRFTHMNRNQVVFVNEGLHWLTENCSCVLAFDLKSAEWRKILLPGEVSGRAGNRVYLLELDGCLSVIHISEAWMNIWVMKEEEWEMLDRVSLRCIRGMVLGIFPISQTYEHVFLATQSQILRYHRKSRVWKEMYSVNISSILPLWFSAHAFRSTVFPCHNH